MSGNTVDNDPTHYDISINANQSRDSRRNVQAEDSARRKKKNPLVMKAHDRGESRRYVKRG
jgi:hypothetical protein